MLRRVLALAFCMVPVFFSPSAVRAYSSLQEAQSLPLLGIYAPVEVLESDGVVVVAIELPAVTGAETIITVTATLVTPTSQQVSIPAGTRRGYVYYFFDDDALIQGVRQIVIRAGAEGYASAISAVLISDDDKAVVGLNLPQSVNEGTTAQGTVTFSQAANYPVVVSLAANGAGLTLPASMTVPAGFTSYNFTFQAVNDTVIGADFSVGVTASVPAWNTTASDAVVVLNNDARILALALPATVLETTGTATGLVRIPGTLGTDLIVALASSSPGDLTVPATVTIPAGQTEVSFILSPVPISTVTGTRWVNITASSDGFTDGIAALAVTDATVASLGLASSPAWVQIGTNCGLQVSARDIDGNTISTHSGPVLAQWESAATGEVRGAPFTTQMIDGVVNLVLPVPNVMESLRVRVTSGGNTLLTPELRTYRWLAANAAGLAVDPARGNVLYTSGPAATAGFGNTLVQLNPATGDLAASAFIGSDPRAVAVTDDGAFAYVGLWSSSQIVQYDLANGLVVRSFTLAGDGYPWNSYTYQPYDVEAVPGYPEMVMVSQDATQSTYSTVNLYLNGVFIAGNDHEYQSLAASGREGVVYAYENYSSGYAFGTLTATATTLTNATSAASPFSGYYVTIEADGDLIVSSSGVVADGRTLTGRGRLALPTTVSKWTVAADAGARRIYAAEQGQGVFVFDALTLQQTTRITLPTLSSAIAEIKRWGANGLALRLENGVVMLFAHPDIAPSSPPAEVGIAFEASDGELQAGVQREFTVTVANAGPNAAVNVRALVSAPADFRLQNVQAGGAPVESTINSFSVSFGDIPSGSSRTIRFMLSTNRIGPGLLTAGVLTESQDVVPENDSAELPVSALYADAPNSLHSLDLYAVDMVAHPTLPYLYLCTGKDGHPTLANRVLELDARTGRILRTFPAGQNPRYLAITNDGQFLYVALADANKVLRIKLADFSLALTINLPGLVYGNYPATDIVTLPGQPEAIAVALSYYGVYVFDGAIPRSNHTGVYDGSRIEMGETPDVLYAYNDYTSGFEFTRLSVAASGLTELSSKSVFSGYNIDFVGSDGLALSSNGYLVNGADLSLRGNLSGMSADYGKPALEAARQRAYAVVGSTLRSYDTVQLTNVRQLALPTTTHVCRKTIRWGADGIAVLYTPDYIPSGTLASGKVVIARTDMIPTGAPYAVELIIDTPAAGTTNLNQSNFVVSGRAFAAGGLGGVTVNGVSVGAVDVLGRWSKTITLTPGANEIRIVATSAGTAPVQKEVVLPIIYNQPAPTITSPSALTVRIGEAVSYQITANHEPLAFATNVLPPGLSVSQSTGEITGQPSTLGVFDVMIAAANGTGVGTANLRITVNQDYGWWKLQRFTTATMNDLLVSGPAADPDGDGWNNLMEYALGLNPTASDNATSGRPEVSTDADHWLFTFTHPTDRGDLSYTVECSPDLVNWYSALPVDVVQVGADGSNVTIQVRLPLSTPNVFFRLKVTQE